MALREIRKEGDEILRKKSKKVEVVDDKIREILNDMDETMHASNGVGLAAVQVGILKRLVVIDVNYDGTPSLKLVNPVIIKAKGKEEFKEGCLSFPNKFAKIVRPAEVVADYTDLEGNLIRVKAKELLAQAICHELDHLDGQLFVDKIIPGTLEYVEPEENK